MMKELDREASEKVGFIYIFQHEPTTSRDIAGGRTTLLKIGQTENVLRRQAELEHQCGAKLVRLRSYPAPAPSSPTGSSSPARTDLVPDLLRVERLIHHELGHRRRVISDCACGIVHREWFAVGDEGADRREVLGVVEKWVRWAERAQRKAARVKPEPVDPWTA